MKMSKCVITGCALVVEAENKAVWGDLHRVGMDTYVFDAVLKNEENSVHVMSDWRYEDYGDKIGERRSIIILGDADYFEQRGVIVFRIAESKFNAVTEEYLLNGYVDPVHVKLGDEA
jgi:hypothetical protein